MALLPRLPLPLFGPVGCEAPGQFIIRASQNTSTAPARHCVIEQVRPMIQSVQPCCHEERPARRSGVVTDTGVQSADLIESAQAWASALAASLGHAMVSTTSDN